MPRRCWVGSVVLGSAAPWASSPIKWEFLLLFAFLAIAAEFFGGLGLLAGFLGRIAAFGILCNMVVAILMVHRQFGLFMNWFGNQKGEGIEYHLPAIAIASVIVIKGSGALSADHALSESGQKAQGQMAACD
jgi:uncharacterized membrane protein YphA (DoxX/SURF4 family)